MNYIWFNGKLISYPEANLHPLTHSLHYAGAVFEGIRAYAGKSFKLQEHLERLINSANLLEYEVPFSVHELMQATEETIKAGNHTNCYIRPLIWRGHESINIYNPILTINTLIAVLPITKAAKYDNNTLHLSKWTKPSPTALPPQCKSSSVYSINSLALKQAIKHGADDALMLGWQGYIAETSSSNIFFVAEDQLFTPIPDCFLNGITKQVITELATQMGLKVTEKNISLADLSSFDECFITGTSAEVKLVSKIDLGEDKIISFKKSEIGQLLQTKYFQTVGKE